METTGEFLNRIRKTRRRASFEAPQEDSAAVAPFPPPAEAFENLQLNLFQSVLANTEEEHDQLSNAIDLWDSAPRYSISRQAMTKIKAQEAERLPMRTATFHHRGKPYRLTITPARIKDHDGQERDYYPSAAEELVEHALRKLALEQRAGYFDPPSRSSGVRFTLYALREELKHRGHTRSYREIVLSLDILSSSVIKMEPLTEEGEGLTRSLYLPELAAVSRSQLEKDPQSKWAVQFHPLVALSIDQVKYRQFNYHLMMSHTTQLARWLHQQLVLKYTFADHLKPFEMRYTTIERDSGLLEAYSRRRDAIQAVEGAFTEIQAHGVIEKVERKNIIGPRQKLEDVVFVIRPSAEFIRETKAANKRKADGEFSTGSVRALQDR